ncbi:hemerythrin family protein [bacterium]|nr:hemerythrin family protein [bacterium]
MAFFTWDDKYDLGVNDMNGEHKILIEKMNKLHDLNQAEAPKAELRKAFDEFVNYTVKHFEDEEKYMESIDYPELRVHLIHHKNLLDKVTGFSNDFNRPEVTKLDDKFFKFLSVWLSAHICGIDMKYGDFANN